MQKTKKIFLTGGTGLVGSYVLETLLDAGYTNIVALRRSSGGSPIEAAANVHWYTGDILDFESLMEHLQGCETVIHCAGLVSFKRKDRKRLNDTNIEGTKFLVNAALAAGVKEFIHVSSVAVFGRNPKSTKPITENTAWNEDLFHTPYAASKYQAELEVWRAMAEGMQVGIINPSIILGLAEWDKGSSYIFKYAAQKHRYYPTGTSGFVDARDVASFIIELMEKQWFGQKFLLNGFTIAYQELLKHICTHFGTNPPQKPLKGSVLMAAKTLAWVQAYIFNAESSLTLDSLKTSTQQNIYDAQKSIAAGFQYRSMEDTIAFHTAAYKQKYKL